MSGLSAAFDEASALFESWYCPSGSIQHPHPTSKLVIIQTGGSIGTMCHLHVQVGFSMGLFLTPLSFHLSCPPLLYLVCGLSSPGLYQVVVILGQFPRLQGLCNRMHSSLAS